jgi:hypothetical protein
LKAAASRKKTTGAVRSTTRKKAAKKTGRAAATRAAAKRVVKSKPSRAKASKTRASKAKARKAPSKKPASRKPAARTTRAAKTVKKKTVRVTAKSARSRTPVRRARTSTPARATHSKAAPASRRPPIPSPLPTRHVAPERATLVVPARSMPPAKGERRSFSEPAPIAPVVLPEFSEAGVLLAITYSIRDGRRGEFFDLMRELKPLLTSIGGAEVSVYEDRSRPNYLMEVFRFKDEAEFTAFDDKFHKDRKIAAIYALLDDIVEAEKSDFKIFERRL